MGIIIGAGENPDTQTPLTSIEQFSADVAYSIGDIVFHENRIYKFVGDHAAGDWDQAVVEQQAVKIVG